MPLEIEKDVPIPFVVRERKPWGWMSVGDSVFVPNETSQGATMKSAQHYAYHRKNCVSFKSKREGNGIRIWRVR